MAAPLTLGIDLSTHQALALPFEARFQGLYGIGQPGTGKSTLTLFMAVQDVKAGLRIVVLDVTGDLCDGILSHLSADRADDVVNLDLLDTSFPFGFNILECRDPSDPELLARTVNRTTVVFKRLWGP